MTARRRNPRSLTVFGRLSGITSQWRRAGFGNPRAPHRLPQFRNVVVPSVPNATVHPIIHTARYHLAVFARFLGLAKGAVEPTREALRDMCDDMVAGDFPF